MHHNPFLRFRSKFKKFEIIILSRDINESYFNQIICILYMNIVEIFYLFNIVRNIVIEKSNKSNPVDFEMITEQCNNNYIK